MRILMATTLLGFIVFYSAEWMDAGRTLLFGEQDPQTLAALEVRCGDEPEHMRASCESELRTEFEDGTRKPSEIVALHCTRFDNRWADESASALPEICDADLNG